MSRRTVVPNNDAPESTSVGTPPREVLSGAPLSRARALCEMAFETRNRREEVRFYEDFGLDIIDEDASSTTLGCDGSAGGVLKLLDGRMPRLRWIGLEIGSHEDLRRLSAVPEAGQVRTCGGGDEVPLRAPDGTIFLARAGWVRPRAAASRPRAHSRPQVSKLAHAVLEVPAPSVLVEWLIRTFGMRISDSQHLAGAPNERLVSFLRCDLGDAPADHHTLAVTVGAFPALGHVAFEVRSLEAMLVGAAWLESRGRRRHWGVGRHQLGGQLFDYWQSPDGTIVEHCADGMALRSAHPEARTLFSGSSLAQWGPPLPRSFGLPRISVRNVALLLRQLAQPGSVARACRLIHARRALSR